MLKLSETHKFRLLHHVMLSLTTVFYAAATSLQLFNAWPSWQLIVFLAAGTFLAYRIASWRPIISRKPFYIGFQSDYNKTVFISLILIVIFTLVQLPENSIIGTLIMGSLTALYFSQWQRKEKLHSGLRGVPLIKNVLLAAVWSATTVWFPAHGNGWNTGEILLFITRFIYILAICFGVDLRDIQADRKQRTNTLPVIYGYRKIKGICIILLLLFIALTFSMQWRTDIPFRNNYQEAALIFSSILTITSLISLKENDSFRKYTLLLDGNMFLQSLLLVI